MRVKGLLLGPGSYLAAHSSLSHLYNDCGLTKNFSNNKCLRRQFPQYHMRSIRISAEICEDLEWGHLRVRI